MTMFGGRDGRGGSVAGRSARSANRRSRTGKTTLVARVLQFLPPTRLQFSLILNPTLTPSEFLEMTLLDFGLRDIPSSKAQRLCKLQNLVLQGQREGKI